MLAAENGHSDTVKVLLEAGAAIEAKNIVSKTITITLFILIKSSYPTYHNNEIQE